MIYASKHPSSPAYFKVRNGNGINFSIFIISGNQLGWQHFRWPFWPRKRYCMSDTLKKKERRVRNIWYFKHGLSWFGYNLHLEDVIQYSWWDHMIHAVFHNQISLWSKKSYAVTKQASVTKISLIIMEWSWPR